MSDDQPLVANMLGLFVRRQYAPGERIAGERDLAVKFGVSRGQVREALSVLEALRVVERRNKSGLFMATEPASIEALPILAQSGLPIDETVIHQSVELRRIHEVEAARLAAARRTPEDVLQLQAVLTESAEVIKQGRSSEEAARLDRLFHTGVVRATHNDVFLRVVNVYYMMTAKIRDVYFRDNQRFLKSHQEHQRIAAAIEAQDSDAAVAAVLHHLQRTDSYWSDRLSNGASDEH